MFVRLNTEHDSKYTFCGFAGKYVTVLGTNGVSWVRDAIQLLLLLGRIKSYIEVRFAV